MSDLLDETLEDIRQQKLHDNIQKYGRWFGIATVALVLGGLANYWWNSHVEGRSFQRGAEFMEATLKMRAKDIDGGLSKFDKLVEQGDTNYSAVAAFHYAAISAYQQNYTKAMELYSKVAENRSFEKALRDYAKYMQISTMLAAKPEATEEALKQLQEYIATAPTFKASAQEMMLVLYIKQGEKDKAREVLAALESDQDVPSLLKRRARDLSSVLSQ